MEKGGISKGTHNLLFKTYKGNLLACWLVFLVEMWVGMKEVKPVHGLYVLQDFSTV